MFVVVSPAKKLDMSPIGGVEATTPEFTDASRDLAQYMQVAAKHAQGFAMLGKQAEGNVHDRHIASFLFE